MKATYALGYDLGPAPVDPGFAEPDPAVVTHVRLELERIRRRHLAATPIPWLPPSHEPQEL